MSKWSPLGASFVLAALLVASSFALGVLIGPRVGNSDAAIWLFLPCWPALIPLLALGGGPHEVNGEPWLAPLAALFSVLLWWGVFYVGIRQFKLRRESRGRIERGWRIG